MQQSIGLLGIFLFMFLAWLISWDRRIINARVVFWGLLLQFLFALFVFRSSLGQSVFIGLNSLVIRIVEAAQEGPRFVFGALVDPDSGLGFILFFQGLATILVISALLSILYHIGLMNWVLKLFASVFSRLTRTSGAESLVATSNIFIGNETLLMIRPYLPKLTRSELCVVLSACMGTISANVIGAYVNILQDSFATIAGHLISASVLSVPAAVMLAKLAAPETEKPETLGIDVEPYYEKENSIIEAVLTGGEAGFKMIVGVVTMLIAVVGLLAIMNLFLGWCGEQFHSVFGGSGRWSIEGFFGLLFYPFVYLMGVPGEDVAKVSNLLGVRMIATEIPSYISLAEMMKEGTIQPRSGIIAAYALCGFTHIPSMSIFVGGATALAPQRRSDIAAVAWKSLIIANLACLMTGAIAGLFYCGETVLMR